MGNQSSQLEATGEMAQHGHRGPQVFGPSMSPTPEPEDDNRAAPASGDHDHDLDQLSQNDRPSSDKKKKKRKKKKKEKEGDKSLDSHQAVVEEAAVAGTDEGAMQETTPKSNNKKKRMSPRPHLEPEMDDDAVIEGTQLELPVEDIQESHPSPKRKREQSKKHPTSDHDPLPQNGTQDDDNHPRQTEAAREDGSHVGDEPLHNGSAHALGVLQSPFSSNKKQRQRNKAGDASSSDAQHFLVSHTIDPAPPSAQFPDVHTILKYEPTMDHDEDGAGVIPYSQSQPPRRDSSQSIGPGQIKREPDDDDSGLLDQPQLPLNGTAAVHLPYAVTDAVAEAQRENDAESGLGWLHKREEALQQSSFTGARESQLDRVFSDLQPSQVKAELDFDHGGGEDGGNMPNAYSSSQSNSHSPSVQRLVRLSRSRSRSASRATSRSGFLANQELGTTAIARPDPYQQVPYSAPSSTGSNRSIPARLPSPSSTGSNLSIPAHMELEPNSSRSTHGTFLRDRSPAVAGAMVVDQHLVQNSSSPETRARKGTRGKRKKEANQPAQLAEADAVNRDAPINGDTMDVDQDSAVDDISGSRNKRSKRAAMLGQKKKRIQPTRSAEAGMGINDDAHVVDTNEATQAEIPKKASLKGHIHDALADRNVHLLANGLPSPVKGSQQLEAGSLGVSDDELPLDYMPAAEEVDPIPSISQAAQRAKKRQPESLLVREDKALDPIVALEDTSAAPEPMVQAEEPTTSPKKKRKKRVLRDTAALDVPDVGAGLESANEGQVANPESVGAQNTTTTRNDSVEPGDSASQPQSKAKLKGKKKRMLSQSQATLSLSQMEDGGEEEDFSTMFARRKSTRTSAVGGSRESEQREVGVSQAPSPGKPRTSKRKRRAADYASEDEMESLLAAGPSKGRKRVNNLGLSDDEDGRQAKRKRLSSARKGKATGPWTQAELSSLGKVAEDFMDENGLSPRALNQLVQDVPNKANAASKDFWDKAEHAIPQRTRKQITERARRIYHNFVARGTWTQEQKEEVHELFKTHPKKWAEIAGMINRDQKDVRDYWRNTYLVLESQIKSRWSKDEEERLREIMEEAISKIRISRENSDQPGQNSRAKGGNDETMIDWQQISAAMGLTRSRQQCKWKWVDMRERGLVGDDSIPLPTHPRSSVGPNGNLTNGISEELANAREDYRGMGPEEKFRLVDAIKDSGAREDKTIPWRTLVDERFRTKWHRPTLRLVWHRLRQTVPNYEEQDVEANARHLVNYYHMHQMLPRFEDNQADEQVEEHVIHYNRGKHIWKKPSGDLRAVRERQRRSSSASSRASSRRRRRKVSSEILNLSEEDEEEIEARRSGTRASTELGEERGRHARGDGLQNDGFAVQIPGHLKGEAAKQALAQARAKAKGKQKAMPKGRVTTARSNSVAVDSESE